MADPYAIYDETYAKALEQIQGKKTAGEAAKAEKERGLGNQLTETNRGYNIQYKNATNPFGYNAEQRGVMGTGVSEYFKNAAYGNFLQGVGKSQQTYQESLNTINSDFDNFLLELSGLENQALNTKNTSYVNQQQYDAEQVRLAEAAAEQKRQYDASQAEQQRQFDTSMSFDQQQYADSLAAANAKVSGASGGVSSSGIDLEETGGYNKNAKFTGFNLSVGDAAASKYVPRSAVTSAKAPTAKTWVGAVAKPYIPRSAIR